MTTLGSVIAERRLQLGLTKAEAARRAGVSRGTWYELEGDRRRNASTDTLNRFDRALEWERGTLRRMARPLEQVEPMRIYSDPTTTGPDESREWFPPDPAQTTIDNATAWRRRLVSFAATMSAEQVREVVTFIEHDLEESSWSARREIEELRTELRALRDVIDNP